jgi:hypothetical protein
VASHVGTNSQHNPKSNSTETVQDNLRRGSWFQGEPYVVEKHEFQNILQGRGEKMDPIPYYQSTVCGKSP